MGSKYAKVVPTLAPFAALGDTSYAVTKLRVSATDNSGPSSSGGSGSRLTAVVTCAG